MPPRSLLAAVALLAAAGCTDRPLAVDDLPIAAPPNAMPTVTVEPAPAGTSALPAPVPTSPAPAAGPSSAPEPSPSAEEPEAEDGGPAPTPTPTSSSPPPAPPSSSPPAPPLARLDVSVWDRTQDLPPRDPQVEVDGTVWRPRLVHTVDGPHPMGEYPVDATLVLVVRPDGVDANACRVPVQLQGAAPEATEATVELHDAFVYVVGPAVADGGASCPR